jgi:FKBP-type peptidyl-prolyl cis-trans isomerase FkpA
MRIRIFNLLLILSFAGVAFFSCKRSTLQIEKAQEVDYIRRYVQKFLPGIQPTALGLYYKPIVVGDLTTDSIKAGDLVKVYYEGYLIQDTVGIGIKNGTMFDTSGDYEPFSFTVGGGAVITGWEEGIRLMKDGGEAIWVMPSNLGYAAQAQAHIPAYSPLIFHIKVYKVYRSTDVYPIIQKMPPGSQYFKQ